MTDGLIRIRGHHLLCMLTYAGKGYSEGFVNNFNEISERVNGGALIEVVNGPDDICKGWDLKGCPQRHDTLCSEPVVHQRDLRAIQSLNKNIFPDGVLGVGHRFSLTDALVNHLRINFTKGTIRGACADCEWHRLCTQIAGQGYNDVKLQPRAAPLAGRVWADSPLADALKSPRDQLAFPALIR